MLKIILTVGASCSGKTTWVESFVRNRDDWLNINRDDIRFSKFCNGIKDWSLYNFSKSNETAVSKVVADLTSWAVEVKKNIIISDTNLNQKTRDNWKQWALANNYEYEEKPFPCDWYTLMKRHSFRANSIPLNEVRRQYMDMLAYLGIKKYQPNEALHKAAIVDVDGTVAYMGNHRGPFEWDKVSQDLPRKEIIYMVRGLYESGYRIIFLSGRDGICYNDTHKWLKRHVGFPFELHMRPEKDFRKDFVVKEELFWPLTEKWNICLAIDDRPQVLRLWEELGIPTVNVNLKGIHSEF